MPRLSGLNRNLGSGSPSRRSQLGSFFCQGLATSIFALPVAPSIPAFLTPVLFCSHAPQDKSMYPDDVPNDLRLLPLCKPCFKRHTEPSCCGLGPQPVPLAKVLAEKVSETHETSLVEILSASSYGMYQGQSLTGPACSMGCSEYACTHLRIPGCRNICWTPALVVETPRMWSR